MIFSQKIQCGFKNFLLLIGLAGLLMFASCKDEPIEYKLDRASAFSFRLDTFDLVTTNEVVFMLGPQVLHFFDDSTRVLFQRISLQAHGMTPSSVEYWFIVDFDTHADGDAVGSYTTEYDYDNGGINNMRLIINNDGVYSEFLSVPDLNTVYFQVDAQETSEKIMKGVFGGILFKNGDPAEQGKLISDGVFKDISY